jgi:hypothetical protein
MQIDPLMVVDDAEMSNKASPSSLVGSPQTP